MKTILIVDDYLTTREKLAVYWKEKGYVPHLADSLENAIELINAHRMRYGGRDFKIILTDLDLGTLRKPTAMADGLLLLRWCLKNNVKAWKILHSTAFNTTARQTLFEPLKWLAKQWGADQVQAKRILLRLANKRIRKLEKTKHRKKRPEPVQGRRLRRIIRTRRV